jgi:hypothetical protein
MSKDKAVLLALLVLLLTAPVFSQRRKMGLLVGINEYDGTAISKLKSCVNDAINMRSRLTGRYGFKTASVGVLTDAQATRGNIIDGLDRYEKQMKSGDIFVFFYSGHGSVFPDALSPVSDETDQTGIPGSYPTGYYDSALVPVDAKSTASGRAWKNLILDDELNQIFSKFTAKGVQVIFISDSCHAGTLAKDINSHRDNLKFVAPKALGFDLASWSSSIALKGKKTSERFSDIFLVIGSSQDDQFSQGSNSIMEMSLFTKIFIAELDSFSSLGKTFTYRDVNERVKQKVKEASGGTQTPHLDDRFFDSNLLDRPIFSLIDDDVPVAGADSQTVVIKVTDRTGNPIAGAALGVFPLGANITMGNVRKEDLLVSGVTDGRGLFSSGGQILPIGFYQVKVVKRGYQAFNRKMEFPRSRNNTVFLVFQLERE